MVDEIVRWFHFNFQFVCLCLVCWDIEKRIKEWILTIQDNAPEQQSQSVDIRQKKVITRALRLVLGRRPRRCSRRFLKTCRVVEQSATEIRQLSSNFRSPRATLQLCNACKPSATSRKSDIPEERHPGRATVLSNPTQCCFRINLGMCRDPRNL